MSDKKPQGTEIPRSDFRKYFNVLDHFAWDIAKDLKFNHGINTEQKAEDLHEQLSALDSVVFKAIIYWWLSKTKEQIEKYIKLEEKIGNAIIVNYHTVEGAEH